MNEKENDLFKRTNRCDFLGPVYFGSSQDQTGILNFFNSSSVNATTFQAGNATAAVTYTLPTAAPAGNNYQLASSTAGVLSWFNAPGTYAALGSSPSFTSETLTNTSNQLTLGTTRTVILNAPTPATTNRTWTIPDISSDGTFAALEGTQTFSGSKTFSSDTIFSADIYTVSYQDYSATSTIVGWSAFTTKSIYYKKIGKLVFVWFTIDGTSNATNATFTLPFAVSNTVDIVAIIARVRDNNVDLTTPGQVEIDKNTSTVNLTKDCAGGTFTSSNRKIVQGQFSYQTT